jgi:hypothetical protein
MPTSSPGRLFKGDSPPTEQEQSDLWIGQTDGYLYRHDGVNFKVIAPASAAATAPVSRTGSYAAAAGDGTALVDATLGQVTATLPTAVGNAGQRLTFVKVDGSANAMVIATTGGQTISGNANLTVTVRWTSVIVESDGSNWVIV